MSDVFISYKKEDFEQAEKIASKLRDEGFSVWWDDNITPRDDWDAEIERELGAASAVVVLWTERSVKSDWVRREAHYALERHKLVPVMLEPCAVPLAFTLLQVVTLAGWQSVGREREWRKLLSWIVDLAGSKPGNANVPQALSAAMPNPFREIVATLPSGESVVDGAFVNASTPAGTVFRDGEGSPVMRLIAPGAYLRGAAPTDRDASSSELPQRRVEIPRSLAIGIYPVLVGEYVRIAGAAAAGNRPANDPQTPMTQVSFNDALEFARHLSENHGEAYRLPSESEWEFACRAGTQTRFSVGDEMTERCACFNRTTGPVPAGGFASNGFGLYDMHGNVREWTADLWRDSYDTSPLDGTPSLQGHSAMRVVRGGGWSDPPSLLRSSARMRGTDATRAAMIGFRLVRGLAG